VFKPLHGFTLEILAIDSEYTLGDLEARKREIRERLQTEGVFEANKRLSAAWDFNNILVVAPAGGAGLGDFQAEANRLEKFGVCHFTYAYSRFQGEGAASEICDALHAAINAWDILNSQSPDAVVIIRGGGAVNDLAWLNNYDLARYICDLPIPVWTGIGHERDITLIDEVAHKKFDTPSKVIAGIEKLIASRVFETQANFAEISNVAATAIHAARANVSALDVAVRADALRHIANGKQETSVLLSQVRVDAMKGVRTASEQSREAFQLVKTEAAKQVAQAKRDVPAFLMQITVEAKHALKTASEECESLKGQVLERAQLDAKQVRTATNVALADVGTSARMWVREGANRSEALMREIAGQGPQKTLSRGFAIVRNQQGSPLTRAEQVNNGTAIEIQFSDGRITAVTEENI
jgi:exodeoxyribonuclease VII large subunit